MVGSLLDGAAGVNLASYGGKTPLFVASQSGQRPILWRLLVAPGVDVGARHPQGSFAVRRRPETGTRRSSSGCSSRVEPAWT